MKNLRTIIVLILTGIALISCKKQEIPTISTAEVIEIKNNSAVSVGNITDEGSGTIISRGRFQRRITEFISNPHVPQILKRKI